MSRPGGVLWPKRGRPYLRIILGYTSAYTRGSREGRHQGQLKINWSPTNADTSHSASKVGGGRDYASNAYGMQRKDWAA